MSREGRVVRRCSLPRSRKDVSAFGVQFSYKEQKSSGVHPRARVPRDEVDGIEIEEMDTTLLVRVGMTPTIASVLS